MCVITESVFASTTYFDRPFIIVVDRQFIIDVNIDRGACTVAEGPRDAESWFRAETYYIRILNVSPVFAESVFSWWQGAFLPSQFFCRVSFCWVSYLLTRCVIAESVSAESSVFLLSQFCWVSFCWVSFLLTRRVIAESVTENSNMIQCGNVVYNPTGRI